MTMQRPVALPTEEAVGLKLGVFGLEWCFKPANRQSPFFKAYSCVPKTTDASYACRSFSPLVWGWSSWGT
jgi:hypothetical protein